MYMYKQNMWTIFRHENIHNIILGKDDSLDSSNGVTHAVVLKLLEGLEGRGHHVYTDNYYTSPTLYEDLRRLGFGACGTVRVNCRGMPEEMKAGLKKWETISKQVDSSMMALKWMDKRPVTMLTTIHDDSFVTKKRRSRSVQDGQEDILYPQWWRSTINAWVEWTKETSWRHTMDFPTVP